MGSGIGSSGFRIVEHPADLGIEAWGGTLSTAFEECGHGLVSIVTDPLLISEEEERQVTLSASDTDQLLVKWLEEILYLYDGTGFIARRCTIRTLTSTMLEGVLRGETFQAEHHAARLDVKAITYHQLSIRQTPDGFVLKVYVDV